LDVSKLGGAGRNRTVVEFDQIGQGGGTATMELAEQILRLLSELVEVWVDGVRT
jgi:hypothetical protein